MIKITNVRDGGYLFHYAHFMLDCVYSEVLNKIYEHDTILRKRTINQTLGNFKNLWEEIFVSKSIELSEEEFDKTKTKHLNIKTQPIDRQNIEIFRDYFFNKYPIITNGYPEVLLIEREDGVKLLSDQDLLKESTPSITNNGKARRDIKDIDKLKSFLRQTYGDSFECVKLANISINKQINYFYNAKFIIMSHGAAMSNMLFCKPNTNVLEITCNNICKAFDRISQELTINHIKCQNEYYEIQSNIKR